LLGLAGLADSIPTEVQGRKKHRDKRLYL